MDGPDGESQVPGWAHRSAGDPLFVGRSRELEELRAALDDALAGRGRLVLVAGEPGIGKTRLAEEFAREALGRGAVVLWARCREGEGAPPYWPWVQVLRGADAGALVDAPGAGVRYLAQLLPELRERLPRLPPAPTSPESEHARFYLFDAMAIFLRSAARRAPHVLVFDDLQWADAASMLLLEFVAAQLRDAGVLFIVTYREAEACQAQGTARIVGALARVGRHLSLPGLGVDDVRAFIERHVLASPALEALVRAVHRRTEGNPFFIDELVRVLVAEGALVHPERAAAGLLPVSRGVREVLRRRLAPLSEASTRALAVAAVVGREFDLTCVSQACDLEPVSLLDALGPALERGLLVRDAAAPGRFRFSHALVRETLYDDLPPLERARLHGRIGTILETLYGARPEPHLAELAHHLLESVGDGDPVRGLDYAARAGRLAARSLAYEDAAALYTRALAVLERTRPTDDTLRCDLLLALGDAQWRTGDRSSGRATFEQAAETARGIGDAVRLARAALGFAGEGAATRWEVHTGVVDDAVVRLLDEAVARLGETNDALRAQLMARLTMEVYFSPVPVRVAELGATAVALARKTQDTRVQAASLYARWFAVWGPESVDERGAIADEILHIGGQLGDRELALLGHRLRLIAVLDRGDVSSADRGIEIWARGAAELREPLHLAILERWRAMRATLDGRFPDAERHAWLALDYGGRAGEVDAEQFLVLQLGVIRMQRGQFDEAEVRAVADRYPRVPAWRCGLAYLLAEQGRAAEARDELARLADSDFAAHRNVHWLAGMTLLSAACASLGDAEQAAALYHLLAPYASLVVLVGGAFACLGSVSHYLGGLAATLGRLEPAIRHYEDALALHRRMGTRPLTATTEHACARVLLARGAPGDQSRAQELLHGARRTAEALGMQGLLDRVRALAPEADGPPPVASNETVHAVPSQEPSIFRHDGTFWTVTFDGQALRLRDVKGLHYLAWLLRHPWREFHAVDLAAVADGARTGPPSGGQGDGAGLGGDGGPVLDAAAKEAYRDRLSELRDELAEAERWNDPDRASRARAEIDALVSELAASVGLGDRSGSALPAGERARVNVTKRVLATLRAIAAHHPALGRHLHTTIRTGTFFSYTPDPRVPACWDV